MLSTRPVMGFDFGTVRMGVAVGQALTGTARPLAIIKTRQGQPDWDTISELLAQWQPALLVVGIPRHADGSANRVTDAALSFSQALQTRYHLPVETIDEYLSSHEAKRYLAESQSRGRKKRADLMATDAVAAALILQSWLQQRQAQF